MEFPLKRCGIIVSLPLLEEFLWIDLEFYSLQIIAQLRDNAFCLILDSAII